MGYQLDTVILGTHKLPAIIALTEEEQARGLMYRSWPPPVMAFPYDDPKIRKFWMKNTPSPLDLVFCRKGEVITIVSGLPLSIDMIGPDEPSDLVIELPRGRASKLGIVQGTSAKIVYSLITLARRYEIKLSKKS